jgi:hypothetical protein
MPTVINGTTGVSKVQDDVIEQPDLKTGVAGTGPAFSAYQNSAQTIPTSVATKINFQVEEFDTNSCYDPSTSRFTPNVAGYYQLGGAIYLGISASTFLIMYKNGVEYKRISGSPTPSNGYLESGNAIVYLNGTTDYAELFLYQASGGNVTIPFALSDLVYMQGFMVRAA